MRISGIVIIAISFLISSCGLVQISGNSIQGLYSRYQATNAAYPGLLVKADSTVICELEYPASPKVYLVNGQQMKECVAHYDDAIVYIWDPHCTSDQCYSPSLLQKYCDEKNVELFVVAEYYDGAELVQYYEINRPLFGIDTKYYKTDIVELYAAKFQRDLMVDKGIVSRLLYFKKGKFMGGANIEFEK